MIPFRQKVSNRDKHRGSKSYFTGRKTSKPLLNTRFRPEELCQQFRASVVSTSDPASLTPALLSTNLISPEGCPDSHFLRPRQQLLLWGLGSKCWWISYLPRQSARRHIHPSVRKTHFSHYFHVARILPCLNTQTQQPANFTLQGQKVNILLFVYKTSVTITQLCNQRANAAKDNMYTDSMHMYQ